MKWRAPFVLVAACLSLACGEDTVTSSPGNKPVQRKTASDEKPATPVLPVPMDFQEAEFVESERSRDPFRSYAAVFVQEATGQIKSQREVVLGQYSVDELRLVGIVTRINPPKAMLVDPTGVGHVVTRGQFIGLPVVVQPASGLGAAYEVNWRIDRIREGDIVLIREDPSNPEVPSATRVIALRTDQENLVTAGEASQTSSTDATLDTLVEELKRRLESVEQRRTTVEVRQPEPTASTPRTGSGVVRAPGAN